MFPPALSRYLIAVSALGPIIALVVALGQVPHIDDRMLAWLFILVPFIVVSERFPIHLIHKTNINLSLALHVAMLLLLPVQAIGLTIVVAACIAQLWRRSQRIEALFNIGQTALYVTAGSLAYAAAAPLDVGPRLGDQGSVVALAAGVVTLHLVNTALVALAASFQLGLNPWRAWLMNIGIEVVPNVTLVGLGTLGALLTDQHPLVLPFVILPGALVHHSINQMTRLRVDTHEALATLVEVVELRDPYTAGHSHRVAGLAQILAVRLGLTAEEADVIEQAGRVHDLGKVAMDSTILLKTGRLTEAEWVQMRLHPVHGANVIEQFSVYNKIAMLVRHHHEAWDGTGYPDGLSDEAIPFGSRILAVADTFDAITSSRPYRAGKTVDEAIGILEQGAGTSWDLRVVRTMIEYLRATGGEVPTHRPIPIVVESANAAVSSSSAA